MRGGSPRRSRSLLGRNPRHINIIDKTEPLGQRGPRRDRQAARRQNPQEQEEGHQGPHVRRLHLRRLLAPAPILLDALSHRPVNQQVSLFLFHKNLVAEDPGVVSRLKVFRNVL